MGLLNPVNDRVYVNARLIRHYLRIPTFGLGDEGLDVVEATGSGHYGVAFLDVVGVFQVDSCALKVACHLLFIEVKARAY